MKFNPVTFLIAFFFVYPILRGFLFKFSTRNLKEEIQEFTSDIALVASLFLGIYYTKKIFIQHEKGYYDSILKIIPKNILNYIDNKPILIYIVILPIISFVIYEIIYWIFQLINSFTLFPLFDFIDRSIKDKGNFLRRLFGAVIEIPKAFCYVFIIALVLNIISVFTTNQKLNTYLEASKPYKYICKNVIIPATNSKFAKQFPEILNNSFRIVEKNGKDLKGQEAASGDGNVIVYYNGVTLDQGIKSNKEIDTFARNLAKNESDEKGKARAIYKWVGANINYDYEKADAVLNNDFKTKSGAIQAFETRKGICFDYACLYVAMCRANNIKVRLITGEGFNGVSWVSHAWNQVYIKDDKEWIDVDTTFYRGGNYFNSKRFDFDHRNSKAIGQW